MDLKTPRQLARGFEMRGQGVIAPDHDCDTVFKRRQVVQDVIIQLHGPCGGYTISKILPATTNRSMDSILILGSSHFEKP